MATLDLLGPLFDNLPLGLVVLDGEGHVVVYNRAEERLAARSKRTVLGRRFFAEVAPCMDVKELGGTFRDRIGRSSFDVTVEMTFPFPHHQQPRDARVRLCSLDVENEAYGFVLIEDVSLLREVQRMREHLQSLLVHDLKNPLAAIVGNLSYLQDLTQVRDNADAVDAIDDALSASQRLGRMAVNLLDLSRLESSKMPLRRTKTNLRTLLGRIVNDNRANAKMAAAELVAQDAGDGDIEVDEDLVVRAIDNLVENALRHAKRVTVTATVAADVLQVEVIDNGPGIPAGVRDRLFEKYVQIEAPDSGAARTHNRGLGLTFVQLVAREHGGDVSVACPETGGTIFTFRASVRAT